MKTQSRWSRVCSLFEAAAGLAPDARAAFLLAQEPGDAELRAEVERLLAADARDDTFLQPPRDDGAPSLVGRRIGGFRVLRAVASGGMGTVWEAEQDEPRRKVALKTMRSGLASAASRRRFRFESDLLASLRHPAIAQVYGAGVLGSSDGSPSVPWYALEFVEGARTLLRYARAKRLDLPARLRLFQSVCSAVQHAHQRGVIHRDLKAGNLLVDRDGHVKVIDFGIARLVDAGEDGGVTLAGEIVGTLEAMSPEQVDGRRTEIDTRTDVYALGVVLYELATGCPPHRMFGLSLQEVARCIREVEPPPPSRLDPKLPPEIDWIVATAMAKEPSRRYAAASDLEQEIQRLLDREPVRAGPPSKTYRLRKFCERHRAGVIAAAVGAVAIIAGLGGAIFGLVKEERARNAEMAVMVEQHRAAAAEAATRAEADLAERFSSFFADMLESFLPEQTDGRPLTAGEVMDRGAKWVRDKLADRPLVQARLLLAAGSVYSGIAQYDEARAALEQAVNLARAGGAAGELTLARGLVRLGNTHRLLGEVATAEAELREALAIEERLLGVDHPGLSSIHNELGLLLRTSHPDEALQFYRRGYELLVSDRGEDNGDAAVMLANLGGLEMRSYRYEAARDYFERALPLLVRHHGENDPRAGALLGNLAIVYLNLGDYPRALELARRDLELATRALGPGHVALGTILLTLAQITQAIGDNDLALDYIEQGLAILEQKFAPTHAIRIAAENARARLLLRTRRFDDARGVLEAVAAQSPDSAEGKLTRLAGLVVLASLERIEGDFAASQELAERVLADPVVADPRVTWDARWERAYALVLQGDTAAAGAERERAMAATAAASRPASSAFAEAKFSALSGDFEQALVILRAAVENGYHNAVLLCDPELDALRAQPGFAPIDASVREWTR